MTSTMVDGPPATALGRYPTASGYPHVHKARIVNSPARRCFAIQGTGRPGGPEFHDAMAALYGAAYSLQFLLRDRGIEAHTGPSEAIWERVDGTIDWSEGEVAFEPAAWRWTLLLPVPVEAGPEDIAAALAAARLRRPGPALERLQVMTIDEGLVVEAMHLGPYTTEPATIEEMHALAQAEGLVPAGAHHEIYLGDPRRVAPERLRTVLRQPVRPAA
jgi:hypothetical protein